MLGEAAGSTAALTQALGQAVSVEAACGAATSWLAQSGLLVSVYLQQGDRLRCRAVHGYWQIYDGMSETGVIGHTFRSGRRTHVRGAASSPQYLEAAPDVVDELCIPLVVGGSVVGVLNVEATHALDDRQVQASDQAAAMLASRLEDLDLPRESAAQKLGRHAAALSALAATVDETALRDAVVAAAVDVSGMDSAALSLDQAGTPEVLAATGSLAGRLSSLSPTQLARIAAWVETGTSSYTVGTEGGVGFPGHEELRSNGAGTLLVLPLRTADTRLGMLVLTTREVRRLRTDEVELLELLSATIASCLTVADSVQALRRRAEADALTGLGHHASFHASLAPARRAKDEGRLAVLYIDVDHFKAVNDTAGHAAGDQLLLLLADCMRSALRDQDRLFRIGGDEFAVLARVAAPDQAVRLAERLLSTVRQRTGATLSIGVAVAEPEESDVTLLSRADAAVYAAKASGRCCVRLAPLGPPGVPAPRPTPAQH